VAAVVEALTRPNLYKRRVI